MSKQSHQRRMATEAGAAEWDQFVAELKKQSPRANPVKTLANAIAGEYDNGEAMPAYSFANVLIRGCKPLSDPAVASKYLRRAFAMFGGDVEEYVEQILGNYGGDD